MNAAGSDGEGEGSSEKSAPTRGPSSAQRGGQAQSGGGSGDDDFAAALEAATAAETVRKQQGGQAESGGSSGHDDFAAAEAERRRAREESRRLEARSSDSVQDDIFRSESGERGSAVTSGGPGIQAGSQAGRQAVRCSPGRTRSASALWSAVLPPCATFRCDACFSRFVMPGAMSACVCLCLSVSVCVCLCFRAQTGASGERTDREGE
jgi:hypothetical protein